MLFDKKVVIWNGKSYFVNTPRPAPALQHRSQSGSGGTRPSAQASVPSYQRTAMQIACSGQAAAGRLRHKPLKGLYVNNWISILIFTCFIPSILHTFYFSCVIFSYLHILYFDIHIPIYPVVPARSLSVIVFTLLIRTASPHINRYMKKEYERVNLSWTQGSIGKGTWLRYLILTYVTIPNTQYPIPNTKRGLLLTCLIKMTEKYQKHVFFSNLFAPR